MLRHFLLGKIHRASVTRADLDYVGSITLDPLLIEAAGFMENEKVDIYDVTNGSRLSTYVIPGTPGSGEVGINGADGWMSPQEAETLAPRVVFVDERNRITKLRTQERTPLCMTAFPE
jgi:aspartate 1-decarboxylase